MALRALQSPSVPAPGVPEPEPFEFAPEIDACLPRLLVVKTPSENRWERIGLEESGVGQEDGRAIAFPSVSVLPRVR